MKPKVRFVIYRERVLGYIHPDRPDYVQVLKPSILKGIPELTMSDGLVIPLMYELHL